MLRPDESHSSRSSRPNATRSATCSPQGSMIRSTSPRRSSNAVPLCGSIRCFVVACLSMERTLPGGVDRAPGVLRGFRAGAELGRHRIDVALQPPLVGADHLLESRVAAALTKLLELTM